MDESTLRQLATELLTELPKEIPDPTERTPISDAIMAALDVPEGESHLQLLDALSSHEATRSWMLTHGAAPAEVVRGIDVAGQPTTPLGLYYMCPNEDEDEVLLSVPAQPPLCPVHGIPMDLVQG